MGKAVIEIKGLKKTFPPNTHALNGVSLKIKKGEWTMIMGPSGSGKTTLLNIISCLDHPTSGTVKVVGEDVFKLGQRKMAQFRREHLGMIFQQYHLIPYLNAQENVEIAQYIHSVVDKDGVVGVLEKLGMGDRLDHIPAKLSGGEQQRVAIARAIINEPAILLADEPTGNLDRKTGIKIMEILKKLRDNGQTIVMVTHDANLAEWGDRLVELEDGKVVK